MFPWGFVVVVVVFKSYFILKFLLYVYECFTCMHVRCVMYMPGARKDQKTVSDSLDLKLQMAVSFHVSAGELDLGPLEEPPCL